MSKKYKFKNQQETTENSIFPHKHCPVCNKIIPPSDEYCSKDCSGLVTQKKQKDKKKQKKTIGIFIVVIVVIVVVFLVIMFINKLNG